MDRGSGLRMEEYKYFPLSNVNLQSWVMASGNRDFMLSPAGKTIADIMTNEVYLYSGGLPSKTLQLGSVSNPYTTVHHTSGLSLKLSMLLPLLKPILV